MEIPGPIELVVVAQNGGRGVLHTGTNKVHGHGAATSIKTAHL